MEVTRSRYRILIRKPVLKRSLRRPRITWVTTAATYQTLWGSYQTQYKNIHKPKVQRNYSKYAQHIYCTPATVMVIYECTVTLADLPTSLVTYCPPPSRIEIGWLSATPLTDLLRRLFSLRLVCQSSFSVRIVTTSRLSGVYTPNTDPNINVINSDERFLTTTCKHDNNFKKRGKVWSNRIKSRQTKNTQNTCAEEKLDKMNARLETTLKKMLVRLAQQMGMSESSARISAKLLHLQPRKTTRAN
jgi:hypothetical protein